MFSLDKKRAVVTGAASGIGLAIAQTFAAQGAEVVLLDLDEAKAIEAAASIGRNATGIGCNVADEASVADAFARIAPAASLLINCAGIAHVGNLASTTAADFDRLYHVNVRGTFLCMQAALPGMLAQGGGVILNMASIAATRGLADRFAYSMTKGAVLSMTLSVAKDYIEQGIRCNCISPARVHTPFVDGFLKKNYPGQEAEKMKTLAASQPIGRMGQPAEIAQLALYLCSDEASFLTGCDYPIDGGYFNLR
ncbi:NAD(P)-dependent dehydrogenase, short-chain alcohol dehydrogenase family [Granulicella rosea]|uniref:NAD(P)-dependent dehydrogenase, short-chain alcohol dehydrogenase family n=1 Tax=Granulicella rosea TaxID=474952 RepID=A0A239EQ83_9BACT|nr:SDR family oxidoreductase [Granulicella rosea]SNS46826.1 NAD(P)-dependent dehydrogenase, short-chain alcohol dehydrogenase family [Granulicella rosea]